MEKESSISWSGTLMLVLLLVSGPLVYLFAFLVSSVRKRSSGRSKPETSKESEGLNTAGREQWSTSQYLFGLIGYAIGIGNVWRFAYVIAKDGGAAALLAYMVCFVFVGTPLFMFEMICGQYVRLSAVNCWKFIRPRWEGLGYAQLLMLFLVQSYFVMIIAYTIPYIIGSCFNPLPWVGNSEEYWFSNILGLQPKAGEEGVNEGIQINLLGSYVLTWAAIYFSVAFGKNFLSKVTVVTVLAPVALVILLVCRTAFLPGAKEGILYYIGKFEGKKLLDLNVWANALSQCLFSLSPGFGTALTMSSYTRRKEDVYRAAMVTSCANTLFALVAGFAIFAMIGNIAYVEEEEVAKVASRSGQGLAFIVIASAMPTFGAAENALSVCFFFMLFTLGLDSAFAWSETSTAIIEDLIASYGLKKRPTWAISLVASCLTFLIGIPYTTHRGNEILDVVDSFVGINFLLFVCFVEALVLIIDFTYHRLELALTKATDGKRSLFPKWQCLFDFYLAIPISTGVLFVYQVYNAISNPMYDDLKIEAVGWVLMILCFLVTGWGLWRTEKGKLGTLEESDANDDDAEVELITRSDSHVPSLETKEVDLDVLSDVHLTPPSSP